MTRVDERNDPVSSNRRQHRAFAVAMVTAGALALTACSGGGGGGATALDPANVPDEKTTLTVWSFLPGNYDAGPDTYAKVIEGHEDDARRRITEALTV